MSYWTILIKISKFGMNYHLFIYFGWTINIDSLIYDITLVSDCESIVNNVSCTINVIRKICMYKPLFPIRSHIMLIPMGIWKCNCQIGIPSISHWSFLLKIRRKLNYNSFWFFLRYPGDKEPRSCESHKAHRGSARSCRMSDKRSFN